MNSNNFHIINDDYIKWFTDDTANSKKLGLYISIRENLSA